MEKNIYDATKDQSWAQPIFDREETRTILGAEGNQLSYEYIHGFFLDAQGQPTTVKFTFCFPPKDNYKQRFFQHLSPFPGEDEEDAYFDHPGIDNPISFALEHGAYFVATNMGSSSRFSGENDASLIMKSVAAVAELSRKVARAKYGGERPFGYVYGGSGGGYKTLSVIENTNAFDGAVPYVIGAPIAIPTSQCIGSYGMRILRKVADKIVNTFNAGGVGLAGLREQLNTLEWDTLNDLINMGMDPRTLFLLREGLMNDGSLPVIEPIVLELDPTYVEDFWHQPGYAGFEQAESVRHDLVDVTATIQAVKEVEKQRNQQVGSHGTNDAFLKLLSDETNRIVEIDKKLASDVYLPGLELEILSGSAAGSILKIKRVEGNQITFARTPGVNDLEAVLDQLQAGAEIKVSNRKYLAMQHYFIYQPLSQEYVITDYLRQRFPKAPTRAIGPVGPWIAAGGSGSVQDGAIQGKVIVVESLMDEGGIAWMADWYRKKVNDEQNFRLWYCDHTLHGDYSVKDVGLFSVNYAGVVKRALLALSDWVERGIEPAATSNYQMVGAQVKLDLKNPQAVQHQINLSVEGKPETAVSLGEAVCFKADIEVPEGGGQVVGHQWNYSGEGRTTYGDAIFEPVFGKEKADIRKISDRKYQVKSQVVYENAGTYFVTVCVITNPMPGGVRDRFLDVLNIQRIKIQVKEEV